MADDRKLQDLARNNPNKFEEYYKQNVDKNANGATIAGKQSYYKNLDLSKVRSGGSSDSSSGTNSTDTGGSLLGGGLLGGAVAAVGKVFGIGNDVIKGIANLSNEVIQSQMGKGG